MSTLIKFKYTNFILDKIKRLGFEYEQIDTDIRNSLIIGQTHYLKDNYEDKDNIRYFEGELGIYVTQIINETVPRIYRVITILPLPDIREE